MVAEGAIKAGCKFFAGYPITPASGIYKGLINLLPVNDGIAVSSPDEISALAYCVGASMRGFKSMTATSYNSGNYDRDGTICADNRNTCRDMCSSKASTMRPAVQHKAGRVIYLSQSLPQAVDSPFRFSILQRPPSVMK